jgi:hypothetical protein
MTKETVADRISRAVATMASRCSETFGYPVKRICILSDVINQNQPIGSTETTLNQLVSVLRTVGTLLSQENRDAFYESIGYSLGAYMRHAVALFESTGDNITFQVPQDQYYSFLVPEISLNCYRVHWQNSTSLVNCKTLFTTGITLHMEIQKKDSPLPDVPTVFSTNRCLNHYILQQ